MQAQAGTRGVYDRPIECIFDYGKYIMSICKTFWIHFCFTEILKSVNRASWSREHIFCGEFDSTLIITPPFLVQNLKRYQQLSFHGRHNLQQHRILP